MKEKILCPSCKLELNHSIKSEFEFIPNIGNEVEEFEDGTYVYEEYQTETYYFQIIQCLGCDTVSFRQFVAQGNSENRQEYGFKYYPSRKKGDLEETRFEGYISKNVLRIYSEVINAYNNELYTLCAAGIRAVIEGVCKQLSINSGYIIKLKKNGEPQKVNEDGIPIAQKSSNLDGKIRGLMEKKYITERNVKVLDKLRFIGNAALHELDKPTSEELNIAIELIHHFLKEIFDIEEKAKRIGASNDMKRKMKSINKNEN